MLHNATELHMETDIQVVVYTMSCEMIFSKKTIPTSFLTSTPFLVVMILFLFSVYFCLMEVAVRDVGDFSGVLRILLGLCGDGEVEEAGEEARSGVFTLLGMYGLSRS